MDMLTELLSSVAEGGTILINEEDYLLARVEIHDSIMLAEVSRGYAGGIPPGAWPEVEGISRPDSEIHPGNEDDTRILLFSLPDGAELYMERIMRDGGVSEETAVSSCIALLDILRRVHDAGSRIGYLGPENVLITASGDHLILGGARGVPNVPFSPPEAVGRIPDDPRSDVFAIGLLMFRVIAGSDNRTVQVDVWNRLSGAMLTLLENMVHPDASKRYPNLTALSDGLRNLESSKAPRAKKRLKSQPHGEAVMSRGMYIKWIPVILVLAAAVYFLFFHRSGNGEPYYDIPAHDDSLQIVAADTLQVEPDSSGVATDDSEGIILPAPVVWISNGTGSAGLASEFREGPAADISSVYTCTGSPRSNSVILVRRDDVFSPLDGQNRIFPLATELAATDTVFSVKPVDITILLGDDLVDDSIPLGVIFTPVAPAGTLYVDIANHGVEGTFGGAGAATWTRSTLNTGSIILDGEEWYIEVVDFRDGDLLSAELGIPAELDSTKFLYRSSIPVCASAERVIRHIILEESELTQPRESSVLAPDIWVLLGS